VQQKLHDINSIYPVIRSHLSFTDEYSLAVRTAQCHTTAVTDISITGYLIRWGQTQTPSGSRPSIVSHAPGGYKIDSMFLLFIWFITYNFNFLCLKFNWPSPNSTCNNNSSLPYL
jgi:hypothetical protein